MTHTRRALGALAVVGLLALAGCGRADASDIASATGDTAAAADPQPTSSLSPQDQALKFVQCMRDHGVDMADPEFTADGGMSIQLQGSPGDMAKIDAAQEACREFAPFGGDGSRQAPDPEMEENMRKFAQCMRDNGVPDFPDPDGPGLRIDDKVASDPDFGAAQEKCQAEFLPNMPGPRTQGGGPDAGGPGVGMVGGKTA